MLDLVELGYGGVAGPDAIVGHRVPPALLQKNVALDRVREKGACTAGVRLQPYRETVRQARFFREHPWLARLFCLWNHLRWRLLYLTAYLYPTDGSRFEHRLIALERMTTSLEDQRVANRLEDDSVWKRARLE